MEEEEPQDEDDAEDMSFSALTFNATSSSTLAEIISRLPPRFAVDRLISRFFSSNSPSLSMFILNKDC